MADARALLRAHRSENRIKHPQAAYSDAGKLLCKLCHEHIRSEPQWDAHTRSTSHIARLKAIQRQASPTDSNISSKRKLDDVEDQDMDDAADGEETSTVIRAKRSKTEEDTNGTTKTLPPINTAGAGTSTTGATRDKTISPPLLGRRASNTPIQGVEIAIPSRPATPLARSDSATSTPNIIIANSRSPLVSIEGPAGAASGTSREPTDGLQIPSHTSRATSVSSMAVQPPTPAPQRTAPPSATTSAVDESEWAAFEADLATASDDNDNDNAAPAVAAPVVGAAPYTDATISAPAMTKAELEARSQEEVNEQRKQLLDAQIAGEKEDATRALEEEFDEMEELEGRVKRLKERREQLRRGSLANIKSSSEVPVGGGDGAMEVNGNGVTVGAVAEGKGDAAVVVKDPEEEDEDDDEEGEDEWDGFRFRA